MDIQTASLADLEDIVKLGRQMKTESRTGFPAVDPVAIRSHLLLAVENPDRVFVALARADGAAVGIVSGVLGAYAFSRELRACCDVLYVVNGYRGRHAGVRLLRRFDTWAGRNGARSIYLGLSTGIETDRTARLLARLGYVPLGQTFRKEIKQCVAAQN